MKEVPFTKISAVLNEKRSPAKFELDVPYPKKSDLTGWLNVDMCHDEIECSTQ
jgi:hypothetical protein